MEPVLRPPGQAQNWVKPGFSQSSLIASGTESGVLTGRSKVSGRQEEMEIQLRCSGKIERDSVQGKTFGSH